ncbi:hypothetical protein BDV96DRAFT_690968 [Lophiotrema nucula]|uniref:Uncharacterized protein n=1 Tax=Lophiotrema nucula TaxID=690887 RepID=A0A6A5YU01_9PLEO|nr:hypothetical protein BDV96DRAFT_690968 [Lophiotrema nucula]
MRLSVAVLAFLASLATAQSQCTAPDNGGCQPGNSGCFCEDPGTGEQSASCQASSSCGCTGGQEGVCIYLEPPNPPPPGRN